MEAFARAKLFAHRAQQQGGHDGNPYRRRQAHIADNAHKAQGIQQAGNQRRQEGDGGGFGAPDAAVVEAEQIAQIVKQAERYAQKRGGDCHVGEKRQDFCHAARGNKFRQFANQHGNVAIGFNHRREGVARQVALDGELPQRVNHQRDERAYPQGAGDFGRITVEVFIQAGHVAVKAKRGKAHGQGGAEVNPIARACWRGGIQQDGQLRGVQQPAGCPDKGDDHAADENAGQSVHQARGIPHAACKDDEESELPNPERVIGVEAERNGGEPPAHENIGVGKQIQHEGNAQPVDDVPAFAERIAHDGVKTCAHGVMGVGFQYHQPRGEHGKPCVQQHGERADKPYA